MNDRNPFGHQLQVQVTGDEWRVFVTAAQQRGETLSDFMRKRLGMLPEALAIESERLESARRVHDGRLRLVRR